MKTTLLPPGSLSDREEHRIGHAFEMAEPADWLRLAVHYEHGDGYVYVNDPLGRLRMQALGRRGEVVRLLGRHPGESSCGAVPGPLPAGRWRVLVIAHAKDKPPRYRIDIAAGTGEPDEAGRLAEPGAVPWTVADTPPDSFDTIELWNDPTYPDNAAAAEAALRLWSRLWYDGRAIWGVGGSLTYWGELLSAGTEGADI